ncbi:hypothetical protein, partial [uncultured Caulobacter sp.]|uniref:hypothetical protein n=1 Tax=uncultured Caulobacter sp. TaxID=158749 RepID=UPI0026024FE0
MLEKAIDTPDGGRAAFDPETDLIFDFKTLLPRHTNAMRRRQRRKKRPDHLRRNRRVQKPAIRLLPLVEQILQQSQRPQLVNQKARSVG